MNSLRNRLLVWLLGSVVVAGEDQSIRPWLVRLDGFRVEDGRRACVEPKANGINSASGHGGELRRRKIPLEDKRFCAAISEYP